MNLNDRNWKSFYIYSIFNHERGKRQTKASRQKGNIPYYSASQSNNGLSDFISNPKFVINTNAIIYTTFGDAYYVEKNFSTSDEITILTSPNLNKYNGLFICNCLKQNKKKYSFGRKAFSNKISKDKILLPVTADGNPDWSFMEEYIKENLLLKKDKYNDFVNNYLMHLTYKEIAPLHSKEWKEFYLTDIFPSIQRGKRLTKAQQLPGDIPYISSTALRNGLDSFIGNTRNTRNFCDCITLANSGSVGSSFYQPFEFIASDHVTHLKNETMNKYIYLFIASLLNRLSCKYNFNREINDTRISREKIILPITEQGTPDYPYMEQYIKNILLKKCKYAQDNISYI